MGILAGLLKKYTNFWSVFFLLSAGALTVWSALFSFGDRRLSLKFYDVGEGDAIFLKTANGAKVLIDGGPSSAVIEHLSGDLPFYDRTLDLMILTHPHADHLRGLIDVLKRYEVKRIIYNPAPQKTEEYETFLRLIKERQIPVWAGLAGEVINLDRESSLRVLWPESAGPGETVGVADKSFDLNEISLVLLFEYGNFKALLTGDAETEVQSSLENAPPVTVIKVPHQGAANGLNLDFLAKVKPELAVISVGKNPFGHPVSSVLGAYSAAGIKLLRTDECGTVEIISDGINWRYASAKPCWDKIQNSKFKSQNQNQKP